MPRVVRAGAAATAAADVDDDDDDDEPDDAEDDDDAAAVPTVLEELSAAIQTAMASAAWRAWANIFSRASALSDARLLGSGSDGKEGSTAAASDEDDEVGAAAVGRAAVPVAARRVL